jgi:small multidrug resistance family-3 protein
LGVFAWLLSFHPTAGRAYAAYGGVYVAAAVVWGWLVERIQPDRWDIAGALVALLGMGIIVFGPR